MLLLNLGSSVMSTPLIMRVYAVIAMLDVEEAILHSFQIHNHHTCRSIGHSLLLRAAIAHYLPLGHRPRPHITGRRRVWLDRGLKHTVFDPLFAFNGSRLSQLYSLHPLGAARDFMNYKIKPKFSFVNHKCQGSACPNYKPVGAADW